MNEQVTILCEPINRGVHLHVYSDITKAIGAAEHTDASLHKCDLSWLMAASPDEITQHVKDQRADSASSAVYIRDLLNAHRADVAATQREHSNVAK